jgi:AraC-like DNA-binding protein
MASNGIGIAVHRSLDELRKIDMLVVCAGLEPVQFGRNNGIHHNLRRLARHGSRVGAISTGSFILADAGLLTDRRCTVYGIDSPKLVEIIRLMEGAVENPLDMSQISNRVGISPRQVERLFREQIGDSPKAFYLKLRLARANAPASDHQSHLGRGARMRFRIDVPLLSRLQTDIRNSAYGGAASRRSSTRFETLERHLGGNPLIPCLSTKPIGEAQRDLL